MRNEPSIPFSMKQTMFFVLKEQLGALKFVERSQETFCNYVLFILSLCSLNWGQHLS